MAQFTTSLCEEVILSDGKCGLTRNAMVQLAHLALRELRRRDATHVPPAESANATSHGDSSP